MAGDGRNTELSLGEKYPELGQAFDMPVDRAVAAVLPPGCRIIGANSQETSEWSQTARIRTETQNGQSRSYFLKTATGQQGKAMLEGEYESMKAIHAVSPSFCPQPIAWGKYEATLVPETYFLLEDFIEMDQNSFPPPPDEFTFCRALAHLHQYGTSSNSKFGFDVTTCNGNIPQPNAWMDSWEAFFANGLRYMLAKDMEVNGLHEELERLAKPILDVVVPKLLGPLERDGRKVKPSLLHGDLWYGNTATAAQSGLPVVFDAGAFYGHNEYELGNWRPERNKFHRGFVDAYLEHFPPAEPRHEFYDRNMLYSLRFNLHASILFPGNETYRELLIDDMNALVRKFTPQHLRLI